MKRFVMDYDNTPGVGPKFLFYVNDDGSLKLAISEDVEREISAAVQAVEKENAELRAENARLKAEDEMEQALWDSPEAMPRRIKP